MRTINIEEEGMEIDPATLEVLDMLTDITIESDASTIDMPRFIDQLIFLGRGGRLFQLHLRFANT